MTLEEVKSALRITSASFDVEISQKLQQAEAIVADYITREVTTEAEQSIIDAAVTEVVKALLGDDEADPLSEATRRVLRRFRDPSLA